MRLIKKTYAFSAFAAVTFTGATALAQESAATKTYEEARTEIVEQIKENFDDERFFNAHWGVLIKSMDTGDIWWAHNEDKLFLPASNEKIPTTAAALNYLGPDFKLETHVSTDGKIVDGVLDGNLIVFGTGDPTIYTRFFDSPLQVFEGWAEQLKEKGITQINGNIIGDDDAWSDDHVRGSWPLGDLTPWYYAEYGPLTFNENYVDIQIIPPETVDGTVTLEPNVKSSYYTLDTDIEVVEEGRNRISLYRERDSNIIKVSGQVVAGSRSFERTPTITNPTKWYVHVLTETLEANGIDVLGGPVDCDEIDGWDHTPEDFETLIVHESPEMVEILKGLMKRSQNMYAESIPHILGWKATGEGTFSAGRQVIRDELAQFGVDGDGFQYSDGSGLSRYNYISPSIIVKIYEGMLEGPYGDEWYECQSIAGVDGTLRGRMKDTPAENNVRGKTGTISNTRALSGYVTTAAGEKMVFSFLVNGHMRSSSEVNDVTDPSLALIAGLDIAPE